MNKTENDLEIEEKIASNLGKKFVDANPDDKRGLEPGSSAFLWGGVGTGKTYLSAYLVRKYGEEFGAHNVRMYYMPDLYQQFHNKLSDNSLDIFLRNLMSVPYLLLDEISTRVDKEFYTSQVSRMIDHRWKEELPTLITSNFPLSWVASNMDMRIADRIAAICQPNIIEFTGKSKRR